MANCEKCIHLNVCKHRVQYVSVGAKTEETTHDCEYFKDMDELVERFELTALLSDIKAMKDQTDEAKKQELYYRMENNKLSNLLRNERELSKFLSMRLDNERKKGIKEFVIRLKEMMEIWFYDFEYKSEKTEAIDAVEALGKEMIEATTK